MNSTFYITFDVRASHAHSGIEILAHIDNQEPQIIKVAATPQTVRLAVDDEVEATHQLCIEMRGKTSDHTTLDADGNITSDVLVFIEKLAIDEIYLESKVYNLSKYTHDHNGTSAMTDDRFFGPMGCNGTVTVEFATPIYLWFLENG